MEVQRLQGHDISEVVGPSEPVTPLAPAFSRGRFYWMRFHPYLTALGGSTILILAGAGVVSWHSGVAPAQNSVGAWSGANISLLNPSYDNTALQNGSRVETNAQVLPPDASYSFIPPLPKGDSDSSDSSANTDTFDFNAFISVLSDQSSSTKQSGADTSLQDAYSFIPNGLVSITSQASQRSPEQQALYDYGNEAGTYIQSFEEAHTDQSAVLKNWLEDRGNSPKTASALELGKALYETGLGLANMEHVPTSAQAAHSALAKSFQEIGTNLALVVKTQSDQDLLKAIDTYNASADTYARNYVALVNVFGAYGVRFSGADAGSVFTFTPVSL